MVGDAAARRWRVFSAGPSGLLSGEDDRDGGLGLARAVGFGLARAAGFGLARAAGFGLARAVGLGLVAARCAGPGVPWRLALFVLSSPELSFFTGGFGGGAGLGGLGAATLSPMRWRVRATAKPIEFIKQTADQP